MTQVINSGDKSSFDTLLDDVCDRLKDTRQQGSLRRIQKLEETLNVLEQELGEYLDVAQTDKSREM